jgi:hypothetical protein
LNKATNPSDWKAQLCSLEIFLSRFSMPTNDSSALMVLLRTVVGDSNAVRQIFLSAWIASTARS